MRKAALHNLGCKVNAYETEAMQQLLDASIRSGPPDKRPAPPDISVAAGNCKS